MKESKIKEAVIAITYRCNSRCRMCNIWQKSDYSGELKAEEFRQLPPDLTDINLSGGEPFLRQDLPQIVAAISQTCPKASITISTNGFASELITGQISELKKIKPDLRVAVSLDGLGAVHDNIRGVAGGFAKVIKTIDILKQAGIGNLKIGFTVGDYNYLELPKVYQFCHQHGLEFSLALIHSSQNFFAKTNDIKKKREIAHELDWLIKQELASAKPKQWARAYFAFGLKSFLNSGQRILPDYSGKLNIFIDPQGDIYPCDVSSEKIGNIKKLNNLKEISFAQECSASWMICTARQAIKKHWFKVGWWIIKNKFFYEPC